MQKKLIDEILKKTGTPLYIFDADELKERFSQLVSKKSCNVKLCYAIKANPFLVSVLKDEDILFEVCSPGELSICEKYNVHPEKIVFSGVCKTKEDVARAYRMQVHTITLESPLHCQYLLDVADESHIQNVILRLTSGNQFGMSENDIDGCVQKVAENPFIKIRGIHYFSGTQKKIAKITEEIKKIEEYCAGLKDKFNLDFSEIEYGPGLSFDYFAKDDQKRNFSDFEQVIQLISGSSFNYVIELGRYIAATSGSYVAKIMDIKSNASGNYCIIDGGINHINYYGQMMGMKVPPVEHIKNQGAKNGNLQKFTICGSLCTTADVVLRELLLKNPEPEDLLIFKNIGAYSITEGIYLFLSHPMPAVVLCENEKYSVARNSIETFSINS